jgi:transposase
MFIAHSGDPTRSATQGHYASYNGTAPVEASSGDVRRHRLGRGGDRQLNRALHVMAIAQIRHATDGRVYYQRKLAEQKTDKEPFVHSSAAAVQRRLPSSPRRPSKRQNQATS